MMINSLLETYIYKHAEDDYQDYDGGAASNHTGEFNI